MEQLAIVFFILGLIMLGHTTGQPILNLISVVFIFYLAFTIGVPALMIGLIVFGLFEMLYVYDNFKN